MPTFTQPATTGALDRKLREHARTYDVLSPKYHAERFGNRFGRYEFRESRALIQHLVRHVLPHSAQPRRALDVATGSGKAALAVAELGGQVIALDAADGMLRECRTLAISEGVRDRVRLTNASANALPFANDTFDVVLSFRFLHLLPISMYPVLLHEMARVTKPGGHVMIEVKNRWYGGAIYRWKDYVRRHRGENNFSSYVTARQLATFATDDVSLTLHSYSGLLLPRAWLFGDWPMTSSCLRLLARGPLKWLSAHFVVVYRKGSFPPLRPHP